MTENEFERLVDIERKKLDVDDVPLDIDNIFCMWLAATFLVFVLLLAAREGWL